MLPLTNVAFSMPRSAASSAAWGQHIVGPVQTDDLSGDPLGQINRNAAGAAAHVQQHHAGLELRQKIGCAALLRCGSHGR